VIAKKLWIGAVFILRKVLQFSQANFEEAMENNQTMRRPPGYVLANALFCKLDLAVSTTKFPYVGSHIFFSADLIDIHCYLLQADHRKLSSIAD
jgi:hypothetical protein